MTLFPAVPLYPVPLNELPATKGSFFDEVHGNKLTSDWQEPKKARNSLRADLVSVKVGRYVPNRLFEGLNLD